MSKISLDLAKFKHVKTEDGMTTLRHKDGHELTVSHKSLSPEFQAQLEALHKAYGGKAAENPKLEEAKKSPRKLAQGGLSSNSTSTSPEPDQQKAAAATKGAQSGGPSSLSEVGHNILKSVGLESDPGYEAEHKAKGGQVNIIISPNDSLSSGKGGVSSQGEDVRSKDFATAKKEAQGRHEFERRVQPKLKGLADGGKLPHYDNGSDVDTPTAIHTDREEPGYTDNEQKMAEGGMASSPYELGLPCLNPNCKSHGKPHPNCRCYSGGENFAEGGKAEIKHVCELRTKHYPDCQYYAEGTPNETITDSPQDASDQRPLPRTDKATTEQANPDYQAMVDEAVNSAATNPTGSPEKIDQQGNKIQDQMEADAQQQAPQTTQAPAAEQTQNASVINAPQRKLEGQNPDVVNDPIARNAYFRQHIKDDMVNHSQEWEQDLRNGHITPETYSSLFEKKDTLGKVGTLFGLLLSGAGSGLAHQPNMVLQMMDNQITRDLDAQKTSKANAQNYLRLSQQHEMNRANIKQLNADTAIKSYALAQSRMLQSSFHDLVNKTNAMPEGPQKEAAKNTLGMMYQQIGAKINNIQDAASAGAAYYKMLGINGNGGASGTGGTGLTPTQQQRRSEAVIGSSNPFATASQYDSEHTIPGVQGQSDIPIQQQDRDQIQAMNVLDNKVRDVLSFAQQHRGSLNPQVIAQAKQKAEELTAFYNKSVDSLGMTQGRLGWLEEQIKKNPTSIIQQLLGNNARLTEIRDSNASRRNQLLHDKYGFPQQQSSPTQQTQPQTKTDKDGNVWKRGPNGEAILVSKKNQ